jgi:hypothetical protein
MQLSCEKAFSVKVLVTFLEAGCQIWFWTKMLLSFRMKYFLIISGSVTFTLKINIHNRKDLKQVHISS